MIKHAVARIACDAHAMASHREMEAAVDAISDCLRPRAARDRIFSRASAEAEAAGTTIDLDRQWKDARRGVHTIKGNASYVGLYRFQSYSLLWLEARVDRSSLW